MAFEEEEHQHRIKIHRCRFMEYEPKAVTLMAPSRSGNLLAVARENGNIEIRVAKEKLRVRQVLPGTEGQVLRALAWSSDLVDSRARLFAGGLDGFVLEYNVERLVVRHRRDSYGGAIWCLATVPSLPKIAVGCEDGSVKIFNVDNRQLEYERSLPTIHCRVLALSWHPSGEALFAGGLDGTIRHFNPTTGQSKYRITLQGRSGSVIPTLVWCLKVLADWTIVSGDSLGNVQIWDGQTGVLTQSFSLHEADILTIAASPCGSAVFAAGVDSKLIQLKRDRYAATSRGEGQGRELVNSGRWVLTSSNRAHSHDVLALELVKGVKIDGSPFDLLVSGGKDTKLCTYHVDDFHSKRPRYISPYPYFPVGSLASQSKHRLFLMRHDRKLHLWGLADTNLAQEQHPLLEVQAVGKGNITCAALAPNGKHLAYATAKSVRVFKVKVHRPERGAHEADTDDEDDDEEEEWRRKFPTVHLTKVSSEVSTMEGVTALTFTADSKTLVLGSCAGVVSVLDLSDKTVRHSRELDEESDDEGEEGGMDLEREDRRVKAILWLSCSSEGRYVAAGAIDGLVVVLDLATLKRWWVPPELEGAPTAMAFHCSTPRLLVATITNRIFLLDVQGRRLSDWSRDVGHRLPPELLQRPDLITGVCFNPAAPDSIILHGFGFLCHADLGKPMGKHAKLLPETHPTAQAQKEALAKLQEEKSYAKRRRLMKQQKGGGRGGREGEEERADTGRYGPGGGAGEGAGSSMVVASPSASKDEMRGKGDGVSKKREARAKSVEVGEWNILIHLGYQGIFSVSAAGPDELVVVEEPWIQIASKLPDVLMRRRYGT